MARKNFSRFTQPVACKVCGKLTTYDGGSGLEMCRECEEDSYTENAHLDGLHDDKEDVQYKDDIQYCPMCDEKNLTRLQLRTKKSNQKTTKESIMTVETKKVAPAVNAKSTKETPVKTETKKTPAKKPGSLDKVAKRMAAKQRAEESVARAVNAVSSKPAAKAPEKKEAKGRSGQKTDGEKRDATIPNEARLTVLVKENPKRGKKARAVFDAYLKSKTVGDFRERCRKQKLDAGYLHSDIRRNLIKVSK